MRVCLLAEHGGLWIDNLLCKLVFKSRTEKADKSVWLFKLKHRGEQATDGKVTFNGMLLKQKL